MTTVRLEHAVTCVPGANSLEHDGIERHIVMVSAGIDVHFVRRPGTSER